MAQSSLESLLPFEKFKAEVKNATNRTFSPPVLRMIYDGIAEQRNRAVVDVVRDNIQRLFDVPLDSLPESKRTVSTLSIANLCTRLQRVSESLQVDHDLKQQQTAAVVLSIAETVEVLLQLNGSTAATNDTVDDVIADLTKLQSYLKSS